MVKRDSCLKTEKEGGEKNGLADTVRFYVVVVGSFDQNRWTN